MLLKDLFLIFEEQFHKQVVDLLGLLFAVQSGEHLCHADGVACLLGGTAGGAGGGLLAYQRSGSHLTAGHAVNAVVDKEGGELS